MVIWVNKISKLEYEDRMTFFRQNDKRTYCLMIDFETQKLKHWTLKVNGTKCKGNWYNALKSNDTML